MSLAYVLTYLAVAVPFVAIDLVWLSVMGDRLYRPTLGDILRPDVNLWPAVLFYLLYPLGVIGFAVLPGHASDSALRALGAGAMFGFFTYATYDLTNQATLRNWSTMLTVADVGWGSLLGGLTAFVGYLVAERMWS